jgi:hypothetical protein
MATSDREGWPNGCYKCGGPAGSLHHVSYKPERVVLVCGRCHQEIHKHRDYGGDMVYDHLLPDVGRQEWEAEVGDMDRPDLEQITWTDDGVGVVER